MSTDQATTVLSRMERFVWLIVTGGISLIAGLWLTRLSGAPSVMWLLGAGLVGIGIVLLSGGIASQIDGEL